MQRLIVSLIVVPLFTGCLPGGIDWDTGLNSLSGGGGEGGVTLGEPEPTGGEVCVAAVLPAPAERYSPWRMAASPDGTLYVAGSNLADTAAGMLPGCEKLEGPGGFVIAFAPDGTCSAIWPFPGGDYFDVGVQGERVVAVGRIGDDIASDAYMQVLDAGLAPVVAYTLDGTRADAVAALGDGRWGVVGRGCESGSLYAEYTPGVPPEQTCVPVGNTSEGSSIVVDIPGDTIYLAGRYTDAQSFKDGPSHVWLKSLPLDPELPLEERVAEPAAKQLTFFAGTSLGPRLAIAGERLVIADSSRGKKEFPVQDLGDDCKAVVGWLPKQADLKGQGEAIWLNPEGDACALWIHDMVADGEEVLITWTTATSFWISGDPAVHDTGTKKVTSFVGRVSPEAGTLSYQANPLAAGDVSRHAVVYPRCDGEAWVAYRTGSGADYANGQEQYEATEVMRFWAPPL